MKKEKKRLFKTINELVTELKELDQNQELWHIGYFFEKLENSVGEKIINEISKMVDYRIVKGCWGYEND